MDNFASRAVPELEHQRLNLTGENERLQHTIFIFDALHFVGKTKLKVSKKKNVKRVWFQKHSKAFRMYYLLPSHFKYLQFNFNITLF